MKDGDTFYTLVAGDPPTPIVNMGQLFKGATLQDSTRHVIELFGGEVPPGTTVYVLRCEVVKTYSPDDGRLLADAYKRAVQESEKQREEPLPAPTRKKKKGPVGTLSVPWGIYDLTSKQVETLVGQGVIYLVHQAVRPGDLDDYSPVGSANYLKVRQAMESVGLG